MSANQPDKQDVSVLQNGTYRGKVLAELGQPVATEKRKGSRVDVFNFVQGYSDGAKVGRAALHAAADVFTLGLWEVVGTPIEAVADGSEVQVEVVYDDEDKVSEVRALKGEEKLQKKQDQLSGDKTEMAAEW